jgi:AAA domain-containing protein
MSTVIPFDPSRKFTLEADATAACPKGWSIVKSPRGNVWRCVPPAGEEQKTAEPLYKESAKPNGQAIDQHTAEQKTARYAIKLDQIRPDILTATLPPPQYLWAPRIPRDGVTLLVGEDGLGKSWLALMLSLHAAAGRPLFGVPLECGRSIYVHAEDRRPMIERRVQTILRSWNDPAAAALALKNFHHHDTIESGMLLLDCSTREVKFTPWVGSLREQLGLAVLTTFDPVARLHNGDEKDNTLMTRLVSAGETIALGTKGAIVMPCHPTKQGTQEHRTDGTETRGGGGLRAAARSQLRLIAAVRKDLPDATNVTTDDIEQQSVLILYHRKLNDGAKATPLTLKRATDGMLGLFRIECGDPLQGLVTWFKGPNGGKPFTTTQVSRKHRAQWTVLAERPAAQFIAKLIESGALVPAGTANGREAYIPSPATLDRIAALDARVIQDSEGMEWDDV